MARKRIGAGDAWAEELVDVLSEFVEEETETINKVFNETSEDTRRMVSDTSPRKTGAYAEGWKVIKEIKPDSISYTVGNPEHYRLTHLLERGHVVRNQYGDPSRSGAKKRVSAKRHIKPAEVWGNETLLARLRNKL